jgi:uncharacterized protein (UPF0248 family)
LIVRDLLNKLLWDPKEKRADYELSFIHRGATGDVKTIPCNAIMEVKVSWFTYLGEEEDEIIIPFHRILEVRNVKTGQTWWRKRSRRIEKRI